MVRDCRTIYPDPDRRLSIAGIQPSTIIGFASALYHDLGMSEEIVHLKNSDGTGFVIPLGAVNLVGVVAKKGLVGCGAIDVTALNNFGYPAARVRPASGNSITNIEDLLAGIIKESNAAAHASGISVGMTGKAALDLLS